jgi:hypothetical protein
MLQIVSEQTAKGKKGAALREALLIATKLPQCTPEALLCWQEPEKDDMVRCWPRVAAHSSEAGSDVVVPAREDSAWKASYPIEQWHSENYANHYMNTAARELGGWEAPLDWHFGPLAFQVQHASLWLRSEGELWDAQCLPLVEAIKAGLRVTTVEVDFRASLEMKAEEEGDLGFVEKRLMQINYLDPKIKAAWG